MRLTLRTLLAYLDDVLEPAETREIGRKIQESPLAAAQMSRIREVVRRRRLGAPELEGPSQGIDPNLVAEYLDNTLAGDQVADIERVCLESDLQLAEVAACHQILTLVLGEPQDVPPQSLDRFYALGPVSTEDRLHPTNGEGSKGIRAEPLATKPMLAPTDRFSDTLPAYLKPTPWTQRFGPVAGVVFVLVAAIGALMLDRDLAQNLFGLGPDKPRSSESAVVTEPVPIPSEPTAPAATTKTDVVLSTTKPAVGATLPAGIDPTPPPDAPGPMPAATKPLPEAPVSALTPVRPDGEPAKVGALPEPPRPGAKAAAMPGDPMPPRVLVPMMYTSTEGILVRYEIADQHWYVQPRRSDVHPEEKFACPDPYEATFELDGGRVLLTMLGDTVIEVIPPTEELRVNLRVHRGRIVLQRAATAEQPVKIGVVVDQQAWVMEFTDAETTAGVEVRIRSPYRAEPPKDGSWAQAAAFVAKGSVRFPATENEAPPITAGSMRWLIPPTADDPSGGETLTAAWIDPAQRQTSATLRRYGTLFEKEFDPVTAVDLSIPAVSKDPRPKIAELATRCLAVTESVPSLVAALARSEHAEVRQAAAAGLRAWLVQSVDRQAILKRELSTHYVGDEATPVFRLLVGITPQEAKDKLLSLQLVEWLRSNYVEVRELTIGQLERLANRRYDYRPLGTASQREPGIQRWLAHIEREGAIVRPD